MALTGFDPAVVQQSINGIKNAYTALMQALGSDMQTNFVNGMATSWACTESQKFFNEALKPAVDGLITSSDTVFVSVVEAMNSAAQGWASRTQTEYSPVTFTPQNYRIDVSGIQENIGGVRGIDAASANTAAAKLPTIASSASAALSSAKTAVANCGFLGGDQAANLQASLATIESKINEATTELTGQVKTAIDTSVTNYGDLAGQVAAAFNAN